MLFVHFQKLTLCKMDEYPAQAGYFFFTIGNCSKLTLPFCIVNLDRKATTSGNSPPFIFLFRQKITQNDTSV